MKNFLCKLEMEGIIMDNFLMDNYIENGEYKKIAIEPEKRIYKEILTPCIARFRVKQFDGRETDLFDWNMVAVKNLSADGITFNYYKKKLGFGSLMDLEIDFIRSSSAISCVARVVRIEEAPTNSMFRITTEFTDINALDRESINTTVETIFERKVKKRVYSENKIKTALDRMKPFRTALLHGW